MSMIANAVESGRLDKSACLTLKDELGFADSFLHGRLGVKEPFRACLWSQC